MAGSFYPGLGSYPFPFVCIVSIFLLIILFKDGDITFLPDEPFLQGSRWKLGIECGLDRCGYFLVGNGLRVGLY